MIVNARLHIKALQLTAIPLRGLSAAELRSPLSGHPMRFLGLSKMVPFSELPSEGTSCVS